MAIRRRQIHSLVERLLAEHNINSVPVDVRELAGALNVQVHNESVADNLSGFLIRNINNSRALIGVNGAHSDVRQRFTIAHELGHLLLHDGDQLHVDQRERTDLGLRIKWRNDKSGLGIDDEEKEANCFAAELLMPLSFLERNVSETKSAAPKAGDEDVIEKLADNYGVSVQAMTFRLTNLGLLEF